MELQPRHQAPSLLQHVCIEHLSSHAAPPEHAHDGSAWCDCDDHQSTWSSVAIRHCCSVCPRSAPFGPKLGPPTRAHGASWRQVGWSSTSRSLTSTVLPRLSSLLWRTCGQPRARQLWLLNCSQGSIPATSKLTTRREQIRLSLPLGTLPRPGTFSFLTALLSTWLNQVLQKVNRFANHSQDRSSLVQAWIPWA